LNLYLHEAVAYIAMIETGLDISHCHIVTVF